MIKHNLSRKIFSIALSIITVISSGYTPTYGDMNQSSVSQPSVQKQETTVSKDETSEFTYGYIDSGYKAPSIDNPDTADNSMVTYGNGLAASPVIPSSYNSSDYGYVTDVKNQYSLGICWAFAAVASMESYALTHGLVKSPSDIDLSEYALAYMTFDDREFTDILGGTDGDYTMPFADSNMLNAMNTGGNNEIAFKTLSKWAGIVNERDAPYTTFVDSNPYHFDRSKISYIMTGQYYISMKDTDMIKAAIMENGAVASYYYADDKYSNNYASGNAIYYDYYNYNYESTYINHAIAIVGWDDSIDKSNFTITDSSGTHTPAGNGAWLVKNSWGPSSGNNGYIWISYYDKAMSEMNGVVYEIAPADKYDYNYQYDGSTIFAKDSFLYYGKKYAGVFNMNSSSSQSLKAVSFATRNSTRNYSIQIYKNPEGGNPESGQPVFDTPVTGSTTFAGYYTVSLPKNITLNNGDTFSVVITFDQYTVIEQSLSSNYVGAQCQSVNVCDVGQSYYYSESSRSFSDMSYYGSNLCIKAFANDNDTALSVPDITAAKQVSINSINISWKNIPAATSYELYRSTSPNGTYSLIASTSDTSYTDINIAFGNAYYYKVKAVNNSTSPVSGSDYSSIKSVWAGVPETTITECATDGSSITIKWNSVNGAAGYKVFRSTDGISYNLVKTADSGTLSYSDSNVKYNTKYYYTIKTYININGVSRDSLSSPAVTGQKLLLPVSNLTISNENYQRMILKWSSSPKCTGYKIIRSVLNPASNQYTEYNKTIADIPSSQTVFNDNTSNIATESTVIYTIVPYISEDGVKKEGQAAKTSSYVRYAPLKNITWNSDSSKRITITWDSFEKSLGISGQYYIYISSSSSGPYTIFVSSAADGSLQTFTLPDAYSSEQYYYVKVAAYYNNNLSRRFITALQSTPVKAGGTAVAPALSSLSDITLLKGNTGSLKISITNKDIYNTYSYQWYVSDTRSGNGSKISGATKDTYTPPSKTIGTKYYYCIVTAAYKGSSKSTKSNSAKVTVREEPATEKPTVEEPTTTEKPTTPEEPTVPSVTLPSKITSTTRTINQALNTISCITAGSSVKTLLSSINESKYCTIRKNNVSLSNSALAGTGMLICIMNGSVVKRSYSLIVTGDTNGDGKINITDMIAVKQNILGRSQLSGVYKSAGDVNGDKKINITDFIKIKASILGKDKIPGIGVKGD